MSESSYWSRRGGALSRRRMLSGTLTAGAGLAAMGVVGCSSSNNNNTPKPANSAVTQVAPATSAGGSPSAGAPSATRAAASATAAGSPAAGAQATAFPGGGGTPKQGGVSIAGGTPAVFDTFDPDRSNFSTNLAVFSPVYDRIVNWGTFIGEAKFVPGLAASWQSPDPATYIFKVQPNAVFHSKPPVNGRKATADDIAYHITRNRDGKLKDGTADPNFKRKASYAIVDTVQVTDPTTVTVKLKRPSTRFLNLLSQAYEFVQAKEAVEQFEDQFNKNFSADYLIGTGPFVFSDLKTDGTYKYKRFDKYWDKVWLDGGVYLPLFADVAARQAGFEQKQLDNFSAATAQVHDDVKKRFAGQVYETSAYTSVMIGGYYNTIGAPWNNPNLAGAIYRAINRNQWIQQIHTGQGVTCGFALAYQTPFNLTQTDLNGVPGYRDYATDLAEAKKMWEAGGGPALGTLTFDMADLYLQIYPDAPAALQAMIKQALGNDVVVNKETYPNVLGSKFPKLYYGNGNAAMFMIHYLPQPADPEPTDDIVAYWRTDNPMAKAIGVNQPNGLQIQGLDDMINKLDQEVDINKRVTMSKAIDKLLQQNNGAGVIPVCTSYSRTLNWNYRKLTAPAELSPISTVKNNLTTNWIDTSDPSYKGRTDDKNLL